MNIQGKYERESSLLYRIKMKPELTVKKYFFIVKRVIGLSINEFKFVTVTVFSSPAPLSSAHAMRKKMDALYFFDKS